MKVRAKGPSNRLDSVLVVLLIDCILSHFLLLNWWRAGCDVLPFSPHSEWRQS